MSRRTLLLIVPFLATLGCADSSPTDPSVPQLSRTAAGGRAGALGVVYVTSQGLYYDTFVSAERLPMHGKFQQLVDGTTEFGPGDPGYRGGRWWVDVNGNGVQDAGDDFFLCPLLGPGRPNP